MKTKTYTIHTDASQEDVLSALRLRGIGAFVTERDQSLADLDNADNRQKVIALANRCAELAIENRSLKGEFH